MSEHTISPSLPSAAIRVPPPSLNLSTASSTSTNLSLLSNNFSMLTHSALRFSVRAYGLLSTFSSLNSSSASRLAATMRSRRCRAVMHSRTLIIVCCMRDKWRKDRSIEDLPVAVRPWMFRKGGDGRCAWVAVSRMFVRPGEFTYAI
jgi:hypothetical protein